MIIGNTYRDRQDDGEPQRTLDWGIEALNKNIIPRPGLFVILGADSSAGKTALALQMALSMAKGGESVGFFAYVTHWDCAAKGLGPDKVKFKFIESFGYSVDDIRAETINHSFSVIFIDCIQLIPAGYAEDRWPALTAVSTALHTMAQQLGVVIIGLSRVRPPEVDPKTGKRRMLSKSDLRGSRQLVNDADVIMMMDLEDQSNPRSRRVLMIDKNKDGPREKIFLDFDPNHMRFTTRAEVPVQVNLEELPENKKK